MKIVVNYLNFTFDIEVKTKSKYKVLNFIFQYQKKPKWHLGRTDCCYSFAGIIGTLREIILNFIF